MSLCKKYEGLELKQWKWAKKRNKYFRAITEIETKIFNKLTIDSEIVESKLKSTSSPRNFKWILIIQVT